MSLPSDAVILLSVVNTLLRDKYGSLEALCEAENADAEEIKEKLGQIDYCYNDDSNQFI